MSRIFYEMQIQPMEGGEREWQEVRKNQSKKVKEEKIINPLL